MHIELFEGERAAQYDDTIPHWVPHYHLIQQAVPAILRTFFELTDSKKILVVGCGTGHEIAEIRRQQTQWHITGIDPSPQMIRLAQMKLAYRENDPYLKLKKGTVSDLAEDKTYDAATLLLVLHFIPDTTDGKISLLHHVAKRLTPGAPLIISDIFEPEDFDQQLHYFKQYLLNRGMENKMLQEGLQHVREDTYRLDEKRLTELLQEAGFEKPRMFSRAYYYGSWITVRR